ncbi:DNA glycosylase [Xylariaceae sp. FL1272]|nr:DNA glycosylase [Xylariaceae sp. FL1272]
MPRRTKNPPAAVPFRGDVLPHGMGKIATAPAAEPATKTTVTIAASITSPPIRRSSRQAAKRQHKQDDHTAEGPELKKLKEGGDDPAPAPQVMLRIKVPAVVTPTKSTTPAAPTTPTTIAAPVAAKRVPRRTKDNPYGLRPGTTPFPEWQGPSAEQCEQVYRLLADEHGEATAPDVIPEASLTVATCGEVPHVLDAVLRTVISGAVTIGSANRMIQGIVYWQEHGVHKTDWAQEEKAEKEGVVDEKALDQAVKNINWDKVRLSPIEDLVAAIRIGGLANIKAKSIKTILDTVYSENLERPGENNLLSLEHMRGLPTYEALMKFTKFPGVGVKTAACVTLFCLKRPCFAVDTHVHKFAKWLKWVPEKANEDDTFGHLELRCPDHLKYGLHQLFIHHGVNCNRCKKSTAIGTKEWEKTKCPLEDVIDRYDKKTFKGNGNAKGGKTESSTE